MTPPGVGSQGDTITRCKGCGMLTVLDKGQPTAVEPEMDVSSGSSAAVSAYRCRAHHDEPVSWRGTGCAPCAEELKQSRRARVKRRGAQVERQVEVQ